MKFLSEIGTMKIKTIDDINIHLKHSLKLPVSKIYYYQ